MYTQFFNLKQSPFSIAPDPRYLFMSERHREALAHLLYGVKGGGGFVLLTGEIGAGKTTVARCFIEQIPENCTLAYIFNPKLSVTELLQSICEEFRITPATTAEGVKAYVDAINLYLLESHAQGRNNVLIIDEAQNLSADVLEQLRLLTNLETSERKLLQIILIGQPELRAMLARPELEQLAQRVIARYHLGSLSADETASYVSHRLAVAGLVSAVPFPARLMAQVHQLSRGVPRRINSLCDRALLGAYVENQQQVNRTILTRAAAEIFGGQGDAPVVRNGRWQQVALGVVAGAAISALVAWQVSAHHAATPPRPLAKAAAAVPAPASAAIVAPIILPASSSADTLRQLAALWGDALPEGEPCQVALKMNLRCHASKGGLDELRLLDRPAMLALSDAAGTPAYVLLTSLSDSSATLNIGGKPQTVSPDQLAARFDGAFVTFWRAPRSWRDEVTAGDKGPDVDWLARQLAQLHGLPKPAGKQPLDAHMQDLLREFQQSQKLKADGVAGPKTFIRLIQLGGGKEPRLSGAAPLTVAVAGK
ncbi:ExeA family protein [Janthinobacterium agaricidamnosum]|uniref:Putative peptidoglycan binding domain protein n=1 Tax=Janthinobacterium agaricidamnosum NBRC 102515 = DSM 9628 TaxID=1349767 RepID=W0V7D6_9BURK|nr:ExeA family protein [Janthinobacterium agaricidamnosum]CDG84749.1 putative peptidoglycan binding domain protein [Janthinobacterium agaricidamnosum NBRC 102515 = DSM 9628]